MFNLNYYPMKLNLKQIGRMFLVMAAVITSASHASA